MALIVKCPTCRKQAAWEDNPHRPFCSKRCQLIDLNAWTEERFRIPADDTEGLLEELDDDEEKPQ